MRLTFFDFQQIINYIEAEILNPLFLILVNLRKAPNSKGHQVEGANSECPLANDQEFRREVLSVFFREGGDLTLAHIARACQPQGMSCEEFRDAIHAIVEMGDLKKRPDTLADGTPVDRYDLDWRFVKSV